MKIPGDAFETYVAMGAERSYQALAQKLRMDKRSIVRHAGKERWAERLAKIQEEGRASTDRKLASDLQAVRERQLQQARFLQGQALKAMKDASPKEAVKVATALHIGWKHELLLLGDPTERSELSVEEVTKREIQTLLRRVEVDAGEDADGEEDDR